MLLADNLFNLLLSLFVKRLHTTFINSYSKSTGKHCFPVLLYWTVLLLQLLYVELLSMHFCTGDVMSIGHRLCVFIMGHCQMVGS